MNLSHPNHPIWDIIKLVVILGAVGVGMFIFATEVDETEAKTMAFAVSVIITAIPAIRGVQHKFEKQSKSDQ